LTLKRVVLKTSRRPNCFCIQDSRVIRGVVGTVPFLGTVKVGRRGGTAPSASPGAPSTTPHDCTSILILDHQDVEN
jgi:hypothetical protein